MLTTIEEAESFLLSYSPEKRSGETYTLGRMRQIMERLGNPQNDIPAVHIAGTSGKTSTAYFVRALLEAHGKKTGLTSSPHITSITERVQIGGKPLSDAAFLRYLNEFIGMIKQWPDMQPSYFELLTAFAFWVFKREAVDYMVIEVGLGGLLDATNVIESDKVCVITPLGLDHTEVLGRTVSEIATQKAGIIRKNSPVFSAEQDDDAKRVIADVCKREAAPLRIIAPMIDESNDAPLFQQANFSLASATVRYIARRDGLSQVSDKALRLCITDTPPGRFETYEIGDRTVILDGAHNPQKLHAFIGSLRLRHDEPIDWLVGFIAAPDDKVIACLNELRCSNDNYIFTEFTVGQDIKNRKSVSADYVEHLMRPILGRSSRVITEPYQALGALLASKKRTVVVTGSLYLVAQLRQVVKGLAT